RRYGCDRCAGCIDAMAKRWAGAGRTEHLVFPLLATADPEGGIGDVLLARKNIYRDVPQRRQCGGVFQDSAEPRGGVGGAGGVVTKPSPTLCSLSLSQWRARTIAGARSTITQAVGPFSRYILFAAVWL